MHAANMDTRNPTRVLDEAIAGACARIAPAWPLDRLIAVNPLWTRTSATMPEVAAEWAALAHGRLLMPRDWFREQWHKGLVTREHLARAIAVSGATATLDQLIAALDETPAAVAPFPLYSDAVDGCTDGVHQMAWREYITHNISQLCAAYFDAGQAQIQPDRQGGLYAMWRRYISKDLGPRLLMGLTGYRTMARQLPAGPTAAIEAMLEELAVPVELQEQYLAALLYSVNGWSSWCAYERWQARLAGRDDDHLVDLLAVRLGWDWLLHRSGKAPEAVPRWASVLARWPSSLEGARDAGALDWLWQRAAELAYQVSVAEEFISRPTPAPRPGGFAVQAVFCIDVRSEVFRRALERQGAAVQTLGFAGFFGLPIEYQPLGAQAARPQLPGLLAPALRVADGCDPGCGEAPGDRRHARLALRDRIRRFKTGALSTFSFVETGGPLYGLEMLAQTLGRGRPEPTMATAGLPRAQRRLVRPRLVGDVEGRELGLAARIELAEGILRAMSLTRDFAPLVLLAGHGSETVNNPQAAAYDCGACCGQTGEVNARVLADLMNDAAIRRGLVARGIVIPDGTHFLAGLHNTTTDEVALFDLDRVPPALGRNVAALEDWLAAAGQAARRERAASLGLAGLDDRALQDAITLRARDWSEVRPEWGLAGNAAFVVAPRTRTAGLNLAGRAFLHDYRWQDDDGFRVLELIMTAPMVVTHWINMQYYTSTVDNERFGSGNKVLHNVVGARIGVFEGNGGDLRIGLPMQSLHDGRQWVHTPLRLSVFIEAPREAIDGIIARHDKVRELVDNGWLFLLRIDSETGDVESRADGSWASFAVHRGDQERAARGS